MNNVIVVAGLPACGKSFATQILANSLRWDGWTVVAMTDKEALTDTVAKDMEGRIPRPDGSIESDDTILLNPLEPRSSWQMKFKTPRALNMAHVTMFDEIGKISKHSDGKRVILAEIAPGEEILYPNNEWLRQAFDTYIKQFKERGILKQTLFLDIRASFEVRRERNRIREVGRIPPDEFDKYFKDGGLISPLVQWGLGNRYRFINNEDISIDAYTRFVGFYLESYLRPGISENGRHPFLEGLRMRPRKEQ